MGSDPGGWVAKQVFGDQAKKEAQQREQRAAEVSYQNSLNNINTIAGNQESAAKQFRANQDKYTRLLQDQDKRTLRGELTNTLTNTKNDFNRRGLLGSGIRKFSDESNRAKTLGAIQEADFQNAQNIENQARDMEGKALSTRTAAQTGKFANDLSSYQQALANMQAQNSLYSGLGSAAGTIAGSYLAKKKAGS